MAGINHARRANYLPVVDYLRGLAALLVAWFHLTNTYEPSWVRTSGSLGWLGVEVFFVISGFIIPFSISLLFPHYSLIDFPAFFMLRVLRLEPPYIASIILVVGLWQISAMVPGFGGTQPLFDLWQGMAHIAYLIPFTDYAWYQPVYWTLAYEFAFYITIGLTFTLVCLPQRQLAWCAVVTAMIGLVLAGMAPPRVLLFVMGIAIFRAFREPSERFLTLWIVLLSAGVIACFDPLIAAVGLSTTAILYCFRHAEIGGLLGVILLKLGALSYSLYLTHVPIGGRVVNLGRRWIDGAGAEFALSLAALLVSIAFAYAFMKLVERPAMQLARRYAASRPAALSCLL